MMRAALIPLALAPMAMAEPVAELDCVHVTKSTLKQAPLARPVFTPGQKARVAIFDDGSGVIDLQPDQVDVQLRLCPSGGTWTTDCPQARELRGDVISFYRDPASTAPPLSAIWGRKDAGGHDLVENVMLRCCAAQVAC